MVSLVDKARESVRFLAKERRQGLADEDAEDKVQAQGDFIPVNDGFTRLIDIYTVHEYMLAGR